MLPISTPKYFTWSLMENPHYREYSDSSDRKFPLSTKADLLRLSLSPDTTPKAYMDSIMLSKLCIYLLLITKHKSSTYMNE